uniref:Peptidase_M13 domain-containing protein n=2 Tax=Panagrellus redivivus TaxID=6233 RepID=A0A7E4UN99_PANRE
MGNFIFGCRFLVFVFSTWTTVSSGDIFSPEAKQFATDIDRRINENVNPCDDFYEYSCFNPTPVNSTRIVVGSEIRQTILNRLKTGKKPGDGEAVNKYYDLYKQCSTVQTDENFNQTILDYVHDFDKLFEGVGKIDASQLAKITAYLLVHHGFSLITTLGKSKPVHKRFSNFRSILSIEAPKSLSQDVLYFFDPTRADKFKDILRSHYAFINSTVDKKYLNKLASDMYNLEFAIAHVVPAPRDVKNVQTMTVSEAMKTFPTVDWRTVVTLLASYSGVDLLDGTKLDDYPLVFENSNTTKLILEIIAKTPQELLKNYFKTRIVGVFVSCEALTTTTLPLIKQHLYIIDLYPTAADRANFKRFATKIADNIITNVRKMLEEITWIKNDKQTYAGFTDKMNKLTKIIGYPDGLDDQAHLDRLHSDFALSANETMTSMYLKCFKFLAKSILDDRVIIHLDMTSVNAYYNPNSNIIGIPIAMLQLISPNDIPAAIYGNVGTTIGHEIIHGFDVYGAQFDGDGDINPWMSQAGQASFDSMVQCVVNEYNEFNATDAKNNTFKVNGAQTAGENVADNGGIRAAYNAFLSDPEWDKPFPRTPKLKDTTNEQLFFLAFNRFWCIPPFDASLASHFLHSPSKVRVLGTLRNFEPFRKAFNCPANSQYAPEKHCDVYTPSEGSTSNAQSMTSNVAAFTLLSFFMILFVL